MVKYCGAERMLETGKMACRPIMGVWSTATKKSMMGFGKEGNHMVLELKRGLMEIYIGGNGRMGSDRATASGTGQMASVLGESGETVKCMG